MSLGKPDHLTYGSACFQRSWPAILTIVVVFPAAAHGEHGPDDPRAQPVAASRPVDEQATKPHAAPDNPVERMTESVDGLIVDHANLHRTLAVIARDRHHDSIAAAHHFLHAAGLARRAGAESQAKSLVLAAEQQSSALERSFVHDGLVNGARFHSDGKHVLTWSDDTTVRLWDLNTELPLHTFSHESGVNTAVLNGEQTLLLTWCEDGDARLWDVEDEQLLRTFPTENRRVSEQTPRRSGGAIFSPNENRILVWSASDQLINLWDIAGEQPLQTMEQGATDILFLDGGNRVLAWSAYFGVPRLWEVGKEEPVHRFQHSRISMRDAAVNRDGTRLFVAGERDHGVGGDVIPSQIWDVKTGEMLRELPAGWYHKGVFSADASRLLTWNRMSGTLQLWDLGHEEPLREIEVHQAIDGAVFSNDGSRFLTWTADGTLQLWDEKHSRTLRYGGTTIGGAVFSTRGDKVLAWGDGLYLWDTSDPWSGHWSKNTEPPSASFEAGRQIVGAAFNNDETAILAWGEGGARLWNANPNPALQTFQHEAPVQGAIFNEDGTRILTRSYEEKHDLDYQPIVGEHSAVSLWEVGQDAPVRVYPNDAWATATTFRADETRIFTQRYYERASQLLAVDQEEPLLVFPDEPAFFGPAFNADESQFLVWNGKNVELRNTRDGKRLRIFRHDEKIASAIFDEEGTRVLVAAGTQVTLWNIMDEKPLQSFQHSDQIQEATFHPQNDDQILVLAGHEAVLWNIPQAERLRTFHHSGDYGPDRACFIRNGTRLITEAFNQIWIWDAEREKPLRHFPIMMGGSVAYSADHDRILATWEGYRPVFLWDIDRDEPVRTFPHKEADGARFNADATRVLTWGRTRSNGSVVHLWEVDQRDPLRTFKHPLGVGGARFNADETRVLAWGGDKARLWDIELDMLARSFPHSGNVKGAVFNPGQTHILTWSLDGTARLWNVEPDRRPIPLQRREHQIRSGTRLDEFGRTRLLSFEQWQELIW